METEIVKISKVKNNPNNPRLVKDDKFKKLVESIKGFPEMMRIRPIVVNDDMIVLGGNMRLRACKDAGLKEVPIIKASELTEEQQKEFIIKDNVGFGEWDWDLIANEWDAEQLDDWGLDVPFDFGEELDAEEDDYEMPDEIKTDIVLGDLIEIGEHRLLCGDSTDSDQVAKLMDKRNAELLFTSPPYNVGSLNINGNETTKNKYNSFKDDKTEGEYLDFLQNNINAFIPFVDEIFYNVGLVENNKRVLTELLYNNKDIFKDIIYWKKNTVAPHIQSGVINNLVEFIYCFGNGKRKFKNAQFSQGSYWNVIEGNNASGNQYASIHKATFPMYLPNNIISNFSNIGSIIIDCFCGTGTTMVAAHQLNRKCYGMELDPKYCQVIIDRMMQLDESLTVKINGEEYIKQT